MKRSGRLHRRTRLRSRRPQRLDARLALAARGIDRAVRAVDTVVAKLPDLDPRPVNATATTPPAPPASGRSSGTTAEVREVVYGAELAARPKAPPAVRSRAYLDHVKRRPCCCCGRRRPDVVVDPAHFDTAHPDRRGVRQKADDLSTAPACRGCHEFQERNGYLPLDGPETITLTRARTADERARVVELKRRTRLVYAEAALASVVDWHRGQRAA